METFPTTTTSSSDGSSGANYEDVSDTREFATVSDDGDVTIEVHMANQLNALSYESREKLLEEMNGITDMVVEDPTFVANCLSDLDREIRKVQLDRSAYDRVMVLRPEFRNDSAFRLLVLRACRFETKEAARLMVKHFDFKRKMFGEDKMVKSISFEDLNEDDRKALKTGTFQVLKIKDQTGRRILSFSSQLNTFGSWHNHFRSVWVQLFTIAEKDEKVQQNGIVFVFKNIGISKDCPKFGEIVGNIKKLTEALPFRICGIHFCYDSPTLKPVALSLQHSLGSALRLRFRAHYGDSAECKDKLMTYGISGIWNVVKDIDNTDVDLVASASRRTNFHREQIQRTVTDATNVPSKGRSAASSSSSTRKKAPEPGGICHRGINTNDVLIGSKGGQYESHLGNINLARLVAEGWDSYQDAINRFDKTCIIMSIVLKVKETKGRFLKRKPGSSRHDMVFVEVGDKVARAIVGQRFRNKNRPNSITKV